MKISYGPIGKDWREKKKGFIIHKYNRYDSRKGHMTPKSKNAAQYLQKFDLFVLFTLHECSGCAVTFFVRLL